ncbi:MAG: hypothetical protein RIT39_1360, partial [Bacteroidota bacterium]
MAEPILFSQRVPGKILLSGEYLVLDGATALGLVSRHGQSLSVETDAMAKPGTLRWTALDMEGKPWMEAVLILENGRWSLAADSAEVPENQRLRQGIQS